MGVILEGGCRVSNMYEGDPFTSGTLRLWNQIGRRIGAQAISLRIMEFVPGLSPGIQNGECDEILGDHRHRASRTLLPRRIGRRVDDNLTDDSPTSVMRVATRNEKPREGV